MNLRILPLVLATTWAFGCGGPARKPAAAPQPKPGAEPATVAKPEAPKAPAEPEFVYSPVGKRDPFRSFLADITRETGVVSRCTTPLGKYGIEQLKLVAVITGLEDPVAMLETPSGVGYTVRRGACIGRNGGVVAAVRTGEVVVTEWIIRADGSRDPTQTVISLPKQQASLVPEE